VGAVIVEHRAHPIIQHRKERTQGSESGEVHDVLQFGGKRQASVHQTVRLEEWLQDGSGVSLGL